MGAKVCRVNLAVSLAVSLAVNLAVNLAQEGREQNPTDTGTRQERRSHKRGTPRRWLWCLLVMGLVGWSLACASPRTYYHQSLKVAYMPYLVKGLPHHLPSNRLLVLFPLDNRRGLTVENGEVSATIRGSEIVWPSGRQASGEISAEDFYSVVGFLGSSSKGSFFLSWPSRVSPPDKPRLIFYMDDLKETVQRALAEHLHEAELEATLVPFSQLQEQPLGEEIEADYALGCSIDEFSLRTLFFRVQPRRRFYPVIGPTWARVALTLTLYRWPSGEQLWQGQVGETMTDPQPGGDTRLYGSTGQVMSVALSRAVGSFLIGQEVQDILLR